MPCSSKRTSMPNRLRRFFPPMLLLLGHVLPALPVLAAGPPPPEPRIAPPPPCIGEPQSGVALGLAQGKSMLLDLQRAGLPSPAWLRAVGDTDVVQAEPMASPAARASFFLFGKK